MSADRMTVHYRLAVPAGHADPAAVDAAFRADLAAAVAPVAPPVSWDLAELARAGTADAGPELSFEADPDYDWGS